MNRGSLAIDVPVARRRAVVAEDGGWLLAEIQAAGLMAVAAGLCGGSAIARHALAAVHGSLLQPVAAALGRHHVEVRFVRKVRIPRAQVKLAAAGVDVHAPLES